MTSMLDATRRTHPHLLARRAMCEHCGVRRAQVGVLCCTCEEDPEEKAAFEAKRAAQETEDDATEESRSSGLPMRRVDLDAMAREASGLPILRTCRWGGCNGVGPDGGHCNRCGSPVA